MAGRARRRAHNRYAGTYMDPTHGLEINCINISSEISRHSSRVDCFSSCDVVVETNNGHFHLVSINKAAGLFNFQSKLVDQWMRCAKGSE